MQCPGNENHIHVEVVFLNRKNSTRYARLMCLECHVFIKWLDKEEALAITGE